MQHDRQSCCSWPCCKSERGGPRNLGGGVFLGGGIDRMTICTLGGADVLAKVSCGGQHKLAFVSSKQSWQVSAV